jgi:hypothetical protein
MSKFSSFRFISLLESSGLMDDGAVLGIKQHLGRLSAQRLINERERERERGPYRLVEEAAKA